MPYISNSSLFYFSKRVEFHLFVGNNSDLEKKRREQKRWENNNSAKTSYDFPSNALPYDPRDSLPLYHTSRKGSRKIVDREQRKRGVLSGQAEYTLMKIDDVRALSYIS